MPPFLSPSLHIPASPWRAPRSVSDPGAREDATRLDGVSAVAPFYLPYLLPFLQLASIAAHHSGLGAGLADVAYLP
jgi:hypothetical protein